MGLNVRHDGICSSDVPILHERSAVSRIPVSYLSLPVCTSAGLLSIPNWTTGTNITCQLQHLLRFLFLLLHFIYPSKLLMCIFWPVAVFNWWSLQQCLFQQPKSFHTTSTGPSRSGPAAQVIPETNLLLQVGQHSLRLSKNI